MWAQKYPLRNTKILDNIRKVSEKSSSLFQVSASLSGLLRSGPGRSPALFPCAILLHKEEMGTKAVVILRSKSQMIPTALHFCVSSQTWDINQGQECRHMLSRACHPFPWFPMTVALKGLGLGGDLFQKEKDAAVTPLLPAGPEGSSAQCLLLRQGTPGPRGSGRGTENLVPMASAETEMGSACIIHIEEISPSVSDPASTP